MPDLPLALTMGEPAGIGAEIAAGAWSALRATGPAFLLLDDASRIAGVPVRRIAAPEEAAAIFPDALPVLHRPLPRPVLPGHPDIANAPAVIAAIRDAVALAQAGRVGAVVTNPIQKSVLTAAGFPHPGHTEFLGELAGTGVPPIMMLASSDLRVVPVTVHEALARAIARLTPDLIAETARITARARQGYDVALGLYHDQALIPIKTLDMAGGVNVTLGLSIVRTSPDHGTALDIAGTGRADPSSLIAAIRLAAELARARGTA